MEILFFVMIGVFLYNRNLGKKINSQAVTAASKDNLSDALVSIGATIDLISNGRAEIVAGRASRIGLYELLGYSLNNYEELFEEKFELLSEPIKRAAKMGLLKNRIRHHHTSL